jgi:hypothetical protein
MGGVLSALLDDASAHLRSLLGWVYPVTQSTVTLWADHGPQWLTVPLVPLVSVDAVTVQDIPSWPSQSQPSAVAVQVVQFDQQIRVCGPARVTVTATHGYAEVPGELRSWCCVLASQAFSIVQELGSLGSGNTASVAIDDYRKAYFQTGAGSDPFDIPSGVVERLQAQYGRGTYVTA